MVNSFFHCCFLCDERFSSLYLFSLKKLIDYLIIFYHEDSISRIDLTLEINHFENLPQDNRLRSEEYILSEEEVGQLNK